MGAVQKGLASARTADSLLWDPRWYDFGIDGFSRTSGGVPTLPSTWEIDAGASVTLRFRWTDVPGAIGLTPNDPNKVYLIAYYETGTGTVVRTFANGTAVANNSTYTFHGTNTGQSGGSPRCGTLRLYVRAVKDDSTGGLNDYDTNSDAAGANANPGALRVNMLVSNLAVNAYPAGSTFAYGPAGDEIITLTSTHTQRYADRNVETYRIDALENAVVQSNGTIKEIGTTSTAQTFTANNTFDDAAKSYGKKFTVTGNSILVPTEKWTLPKANGVNVTQSGTDAVERQSFYNVDPRISIVGTVLSKALHRLDDNTTIDFNVTNARGEQLTRSLTYQLKNSLGTVRKAASDTGANYDIDYKLLESDDASYDFIGVQWTFNTNQADVDSNPSELAFKVSNKIMIGSAVGVNDLAVTTDHEIYNNYVEDIVSIQTYLSNPDGTALSNQSVNVRVHDDEVSSNEEDLQVVSTDANGLLSYTYAPEPEDKVTDDAVGSPKHLEIDFVGNSTDDSAEEWTLSGKLLVAGWVNPTEGNTGDFWSGKTDLDGTNDGDPDGTDETQFYVGADVLYVKVRILNIRGEILDDAVPTFWLLRNSVVSQGPLTGFLSQTEGGYMGWMDLFAQFDVKAPAGARVIRMEAVKGGSTTGNVSRGGYVTKEVNYAPSYTGNLYAEINYEMHEVTVDTLRFTLTPIIYNTSNGRENISTVAPAAQVDIDPKYHITFYNPNGEPEYSGSQLTMTRTVPGVDDHFEATITGLAPYVDRTAWVHVVFTLNGGQLQTNFPIIVGKMSPGKIKTRFNPLGSIQS